MTFIDLRTYSLISSYLLVFWMASFMWWVDTKSQDCCCICTVSPTATWTTTVRFLLGFEISNKVYIKTSNTSFFQHAASSETYSLGLSLCSCHSTPAKTKKKSQAISTSSCRMNSHRSRWAGFISTKERRSGTVLRIDRHLGDLKGLCSVHRKRRHGATVG